MSSAARRDLVIHHLVAIDAQLRRIRGLALHIGDGAELKARIPVPALPSMTFRAIAAAYP